MKNKIKIAGLSLIALLGLTACSEAIAKPTTYNDKLVIFPEGTQEIYNNAANVVYDAIHDGGIGEDVLKDVLYLYSVTAFGPYDRSVEVGGVTVKLGEVTLTEAVNSDANMETFIKAHKAYWDEGTTEVHTPTTSEIQRVIAKLKSINDRIAEKMYDKISGGSYSDRHIFDEEAFLKSLRNNMESVANPTDEGVLTYKGPILPDVEPEDVFDEYLHIENYYSDTNKYVVEKIIPDIYQELLSELYLNQETYNTLGRSYARKVNIIKFENNEDYPNAAFYLASQLTNELNTTDPDRAEEIKDMDILDLFKQYSRAYIGYDLTETEEDILTAAGGFTPHIANDDSDVGTYYEGTKYGDIAAKYLKMQNSKFVEEDIENSFTSNNTYPTYIGLIEQSIALEEKDYTTNGWFIKNGGLNELPSEIRDRLFNISVANGINEKDRDANARTYEDGKWNVPSDENGFVCRVNGHNYLKKENRVAGEGVENDILFYDTSSKAYYIIEVVEAASSSKLSKKGDNNYAATRGEAVMEDFINRIGKLVGADSSYTTLAKKKYLKEMNIVYYDDTVYNYFKTNYPELF